MAQAEVLPIVLEGQDNTAQAWASFIRNGKSAQSVVDQLKGAVAGLGSGSVTSLSQLGSAAKLLANPYVAAMTAVLAVGAAGVSTASDLAKVGDAADEIKTKGSNIQALGAALKGVGGDTSDAIAGLKNLRQQIDLQARDGGYLDNLFKLNGSSLLDASSGKLKSIEQIYSEISGFIVRAVNGTERLEIATAAYGQSGAVMAKAAQAGADAFSRMAKADIDPLVRQSQELERVWNSIIMQGDGWFAKLMRANSDAVGYSMLYWASKLGGSKRAAESLYLADNSNAARTMDASGADAFYNAVRGREGATVTPSNRGDPSGTAAFEKAAVAAAKSTAAINAQRAAVDLGAGALARMETQARLVATAQEAGLPITQQMRDRIAQLAQKADTAADALAKAKIASEINFNRGAAFLTQDDVQIATALKGIYGTDIPAALGSWQAQMMRTNNLLKTASDLGQDVNRGFFTDFVSNLRTGASAMTAFGNAGVNALNKVSDKLISMAADNLWKAAFGGVSGSSLASLFGLGGGSYATDGIGGAGPTAPAGTYHSGGMVGAEPSAWRSVAGSIFNGAPRFHGGLLPNEFPAILKKGEGVFTEGQMAALGSGGPRVNVTIINNNGSDVQVGRPQPNSNGGLDIPVLIGSAAADQMAKPGSALRRATDQRGILARR